MELPLPQQAIDPFLVPEKAAKAANSILSIWESKVAMRIQDAERRYKAETSDAEAKSVGLVVEQDVYFEIPVIRENVALEMPKFVTYLTQPARQVAIKFLNNEALEDDEYFEMSFTSAFRTTNWAKPFISQVHSSLIYGVGWIEVIKDMDNVLGVSMEHVETKNMIYDASAKKLQAQRMVIRRYVLSSVELAAYAELYKFDPVKLQKIQPEVNANSADPYSDVVKQYNIYKLYVRDSKGVIHYAWQGERQDSLLTDFVPHDSGAYDAKGTPLPCTQYPFFRFQSLMIGDSSPEQTRGRADHDQVNQRAQTCIATAFLNQLRKSLNLYIYRADERKESAGAVTFDEQLAKPNRISDTKLGFYSPAAPQNTVLQAIDYFKNRRIQELGSLDIAAAQGSKRRTAYETQTTEDASDTLETVPIFAFSMAMTELLSYVVDLVRTNMACPALCKFMIELRASDPQKYTMYQTTRINVMPAGDIDFVERQKKVRKILQLLQIAPNPAVANFLMKKLVALLFPEDAAELEKLLSDNSTQLLALCAQTIESTMPLLQGQVPPEAMAKLAELLNECKQTLSTQQPQNGQPQQGPMPAGNPMTNSPGVADAGQPTIQQPR
jgi:hypothetical protein